MADMDQELRAIVHQHEADIQVIKSDLGTLRASTISNGQKLDKLFDAIQRRAGTTLDDLAKWLQIMVLGSALIGGVVTSIVYVAGNSNAAELALLRDRVERIHGSFGWEPSLVKREGKN